MGISAFFWLPLITERQYLAETAYQITTAGLLTQSWTGSTFVNPSIVYHLNGEVPFRLGLVQLVLALAGIMVAGRRDAEWLFFIFLAVLTGIGISAWSVPVWLSSKTLLITQFPWRLLTFMTLPLSLFTGGILLRLRRDSHQFVGAVALIALIILTNRPQIGGMEVLARAGENITLYNILRFENEKTALGAGWSQEFWPRWTQGADYVPSIADRARRPCRRHPQSGRCLQAQGDRLNSHRRAAALHQPVLPGLARHLERRNGIADLSEHRHGLVDR